MKLIQILTFIFIVALGGAFYWSWKQNGELQKLNQELSTVNSELKIKRDSLQIANEKLEKEKNGYITLFKSLQDYEAAKERNTPEAYFEYIQNVGAENFGDGRILEEIGDKLNSLMNTTGYLLLIESNGNSLFDKMEKLFSGYDFYRAKSAISVRNGVIGNPDYSNTTRTGYAIRQGQIVNVMELIESGNAKWARISFYSE